MSDANGNQTASTTGSEGALPFGFSGTAAEYFGIWIVNLFLTIITLGIYSAWAKVRRLRYFYGNTWLDGHNFEYHARPIQILIEAKAFPSDHYAVESQIRLAGGDPAEWLLLLEPRPAEECLR